MRIAALGDSITYGYPYGRSWTHLVSERLGMPVLNFGLNGDTLPGMLERLESEVLPGRPNFCIVMGGANDAFSGESTRGLLTNAARIADRLRSADIPFAWGLTPPVLLESLEQILSEYRTGLVARADPCIDFASHFYEGEGVHRRIRSGLLPDGVHPSDQANAIMAEVAADYLLSLISERPRK